MSKPRKKGNPNGRRTCIIFPWQKEMVFWTLALVNDGAPTTLDDAWALLKEHQKSPTLNLRSCEENPPKQSIVSGYLGNEDTFLRTASLLVKVGMVKLDREAMTFQIADPAEHGLYTVNLKAYNKIYVPYFGDSTNG